MSKETCAPKLEPEATPFQNFDRLFRTVISVPKAAIEKEAAKLKRRKKRAKKSA